jgi:membrane associated rhomboid family serine protease
MGEWQHDRQNGNPEGSMAAVGRDSRGPATQFSTSTPSYGTGYAEVLPPVPPPAAPERPRPRGRGWASAPATYTLVGINCAVYVAMVLNGVSPTDPKAEQLVHWGAAFGPYIIGGEWWRLVTAMFVHIGFWHLATNMWCLWNLGLLGEPLLGPVGLIGVYLLTGFAGNLLSLVVNPGIANHGAEAIIGAGASGAIFGIAGALILLLNSKFLPLAPADRKSLRKSVSRRQPQPLLPENRQLRTPGRISGGAVPGNHTGAAHRLTGGAVSKPTQPLPGRAPAAAPAAVRGGA